MNKSAFNDRVRQVIVLAVIILIAALLTKQLFVFLPGILGALTLYILSRSYYFKLIFSKKWRKGWTAALVLLFYILIISLPIYLSVNLVSPKVNELLRSQDKIVASVQSVADAIAVKTDMEVLSPDNIKAAAQKISSIVPMLLSSTATMVANLFMMFFLLYFLLIGGRDMEKNLSKLIPLKPSNIDILAKETKMMIKANAMGIPIICIVQGLFAALGYYILVCTIGLCGAFLPAYLPFSHWWVP